MSIIINSENNDLNLFVKAKGSRIKKPKVPKIILQSYKSENVSKINSNNTSRYNS